MSDKSIFWVASFPKSGNTLMRSILTSLFFTNNGNFSLEILKYIDQFENTSHILNNKKIFGKDFLRINELSILYKYIERLQTKQALRIDQDFIFLKTHSGLFEIGGNKFSSEKNTRGIIYLLRDPRDICISWSKHLDVSYDKSIEHIIDDLSCSHWIERKQNKIFDNENRPKSLISSWKNHVLSWTSVKWKVPIKVIKYEDLVYKKKETVEDLINFFSNNFGFNFRDIEKKIENLLNSTDFEVMKNYENKYGFNEKMSKNDFFSVGKKNQWIDKLSNDQIKIIEKNCGDVMRKFNYKLSIEF